MTRHLAGIALAALVVAPLLAQSKAAHQPPVRFEITVPSSVRSEAITGRVYVMITRNGEREPRLQLNQADGIPFFGRDVEKLAPGAAAAIDDTDLGFPVDNLRDIPPGEYFVQAFVNVYSEFKGVDIYKDTNAFYKQHEWYRVPTPNMRDTFGEPRNTVQQKNQFELVNGTKGRSGRQMDIWSAAFGPVGKDGYFVPLIDQRTGAIDPALVSYWREHYDLLAYMQRNWPTLGPKLVDKLRVYVGDTDTYQLDKGVVLMEQWMKTTTNPYYPGFFMYGDRKPHCWSGPVSQTERVKEIAQFVLRKKPDSATTPWWKY